jgi:hypothetical protein
MMAEVVSCNIVKEGAGKKGKWILYKAQFAADNGDQIATGFDYVEPGSDVDISIAETGEYRGEKQFGYKLLSEISKPAEKSAEKSTGGRASECPSTGNGKNKSFALAYAKDFVGEITVANLGGKVISSTEIINLGRLVVLPLAGIFEAWLDGKPAKAEVDVPVKSNDDNIPF